MHILLITQNFPPEKGGIQTYSEELSKHFYKKGHQIEVIAPSKKGDKEIDSQFPFQVTRVNTENGLLVLPLLWRMPFILMNKKVDVIFNVQWQTALPFIIAKILGFKIKVVIAAHARELLFNTDKKNLFSKIFSYYKKSILNRADLLLPVSDFTKELIVKAGVNSDKIRVVINGTNPEIFFPKDVAELKRSLNLTSKNIIFTLTRLINRKGIDLVIKALPEVIKKVPNAHYIIGGYGPEEENLKELVSKFGLKDYVTFVGKIPDDLINDFYNLCDVFILPSVTEELSIEGFGIVFLEANACKKPVIGSDSGGIPSAILHGKTGLIVPESNSVLLSETIVEILTNQGLAKELGNRGYNRVQTEANWEQVSSTILSYINEV